MITKIFENYEELKRQQKDVQVEILSMKGLLERLVGADHRLSALAESQFELPVENEEQLNRLEDMLEDATKVTTLVRIALALRASHKDW